MNEINFDQNGVKRLLRGLPFFADLSEDQLEELARIGVLESCPVNHDIFAEGDPGSSLYVVASGRVQIHKKDEHGADIELAVLSRGESFGEMALLEGAPRSAGASTLEPCVFFVLDRNGFGDALTRFPMLIRTQMASLSAKVREMNQRFVAEVIEKQNLRLEMERERFKSLFQVAGAASEALTVDDALQVVLNQVCAYTGWPVAHAFLAAERPPYELTPSSAWFLQPAEKYARLRQATEDPSYSPSAGLPGKVWRSKKAELVGDLDQAAGLARSGLAMELGLHAHFAFPVLLEQEVVAVMEFFAEQPVMPEDLFVQAMESLGLQLGRIIERRRWEDRLIHNAFHDALTGLPNRALFLDRLRVCLAQTDRDQRYLFAVLFIDLDQFKRVNDSMGHSVGDRYLIEIARRLQAGVREGDTVARFGGDEFAILLDDVKKSNDIPRTIERIRKKLSASLTLEGLEFFPSASIGIAVSSTGYEEVGAMVRDADIAMYRAKAEGRDRQQLFDQSMHEQAVKLLQLETDLQRAIDRQELRLHYQPIVTLSTGKISGFEALMRWMPLDREPVTPATFIPIAEQTGLILPLTDWVLQEGCRQLRQWQTEFPQYSKLHMSMNLSAKYLTLPNFTERVLAAIAGNRLQPSSVALEITEGQMVEDMAACSRVLSRLNDVGVRIYVDDFGTGYSSLSYLARLHVNALKVDRSFVSQVDQNDRSAPIVRAIVSLAHNLGLDVIAEGVETAEQRDFLQKLNCQYGQGYFFNRPLEASAVAALLKEGKI